MKPTDDLSRWYAFYTFPRAEKKVAEKLDALKYTYYLPLIKTLKQWSDRKKIVIEPVFKSYIFVKVTTEEIKKIILIDGILKVISFGQIPQAIPEDQLNYLRLILESPDDIEIGESFSDGDKVKVSQGPLSGATGYLVARKGKNFLINIDIVGHSVAVYVNPAFLEKIY